MLGFLMIKTKDKKFFLHHRGKRDHRGKARKTLTDFIYLKAFLSLPLCSAALGVLCGEKFCS
jgi:hypothetical protein